MRLLRRQSPQAQPSGQTLVEFALILPVLVLMLMGVFDLGRAVYSFNTITNASREAVRLAIVDQNLTAIEDEAIQHSASVNVTAADVSVEFLAPDLSDTGTCTTAPHEIGCVAQVRIQYDYTAATPIIGTIVGTISMEAVTNQPIERSHTSP